MHRKDGDLFVQWAQAVTARGRRTSLADAYADLEEDPNGLEEDPTDAEQDEPSADSWTVVLGARDPNRFAYLNALQPLMWWRGMRGKPLVLSSKSPRQWFKWVERRILWDSDHLRDRFILIVGGPEHIPYDFQTLLDCVAAVGRISFDSIQDLEGYVAKVIEHEKKKESAPVNNNPTAFVFAPGPESLPSDDPATYYSLRYLAKPIATHIEADLNVQTLRCFSENATKNALIDNLKEHSPALVFSASHGYAPADLNLDQNRIDAGAIECYDSPGPTGFKGADVKDKFPISRPFLDGSVWFHFGCHGYGAPEFSESLKGDLLPGMTKDQIIVMLRGKQPRISPAPFVSSLPKALLAHPHGPLAFVGHVDESLLEGFALAVGESAVFSKYRLQPFRLAVDALLGGRPVGAALSPMNRRFDMLNAILTSTSEPRATGKPSLAWWVDHMMCRTDAENYMLFGDPKVSMLPANRASA